MAAPQKQPKKALGPHSGLRVVNEHFEAVFNAAMATHDCMDAGGRATPEAKAEVVFQQPAKSFKPNNHIGSNLR
jgi:hypothetical protein